DVAAGTRHDDAELRHTTAGPASRFRQGDTEPALLGVACPLGPSKAFHLRPTRQLLPALEAVVLRQEALQTVIEKLALLGRKAWHRCPPTAQTPSAPLAMMFFCTSLEPP